jgi:hypothetical protein
MVSAKFTLTYKGNVTSESAVAKALGGSGPLTVKTDMIYQHSALPALSIYPLLTRPISLTSISEHGRLPAPQHYQHSLPSLAHLRVHPSPPSVNMVDATQHYKYNV